MFYNLMKTLVFFKDERQDLIKEMKELYCNEICCYTVVKKRKKDESFVKDYDVISIQYSNTHVIIHLWRGMLPQEIN